MTFGSPWTPCFNPVVPRREFLRAGALSLFGLGLPGLLRAHAAEAPGGSRPPLAKKHAKACIVLFMWGGPAQQDTWDMKPDAPDAYRGDFKSIATTVPGLRVCEHLPQLAGPDALAYRLHRCGVAVGQIDPEQQVVGDQSGTYGGLIRETGALPCNRT